MDEFCLSDIDMSLARDRRAPPVTIVSNGHRMPVRRRWRTGFSVEGQYLRHLRGLVELYEGDRMIGWCLVSHDSSDGNEHRFEFKRVTWCDESPPVDFDAMPEDVDDGGMPVL
ncbi:hypothetical protein [Palleronia sp. LCG004]|uniref:hypothetical protein n=1 Tax=Palleronia sp. LCG004 TaxID=3079304 RepID=UPI00294295C9|nr:hypothetical protein [Palleronia sp. LCG004]WOI56642.1 hypothetical protein RVY76_02240 [Palleronia sp. LCG004]